MGPHTSMWQTLCERLVFPYIVVPTSEPLACIFTISLVLLYIVHKVHRSLTLASWVYVNDVGGGGKVRGCTREGLLLHRFAQCRDSGYCVRTCRATHDKFRETYAIQSDVVSNSATNELPFQGHRLSTSHLLIDRTKILSRHT